MKRLQNIFLYIEILWRTFFRVEAPKRVRRLNRALLGAGIFVLSAMLIAGYTVAYARCFNTVSDTPMTAFDVRVLDDDTVIVYLNKEYRF
jgi:hypothetical protein